MPGFPFPGRPGGEHDEPLLDMIIARRALPPDAPQAMHDLTRMLAALAGPAEPGELAGEAAVRAAFSRAASPAGVSSAARRPVRHRRTRRSRERSRSRVRLATVMVVAAAGLGSVLAAYIDVLPSPIQQLAHVAVAAPAPHRLQLAPARHAGDGAARAPQGAALQPAGPAPHHTASAAAGPSQGTTPTPRYRPLFSPSGHRPTYPACSPGPGHSPHQPPKGSPGSSLPPSWYQTVPCTVIPTGPAEPAHAEPLRALTRPRPDHPGCIRGGVIPHRVHDAVYTANTHIGR